MLTIDEIKDIVRIDAMSEKKRNAAIGQRYYEAKHDILQYRMFYYDHDGTMLVETMRSNIKISHPFFTELVDQEVQYMMSVKGGFVRSDDPDLQEVLDEYFNESDDFVAELNEVMTGAVVKGFDYMYAYKGEDGKTHFQQADSMGVIEVRAKDASDGRDHVIYWYTERVCKDKKVTRYQVWDDAQTYFYCEEENGDIVPDDTARINPRPHTIYQKSGDESLYYDSYGMIPFFRLDNCKKQYSGLMPIKDLIDDYDLMSCGLSNTIQDASEVLYVVKGFQGHDLDELMQNIKAKKHIGVQSDGGVEIKTIDIPYQAREAKMQQDEKNIYRFGMGFNSAQLGDGNITNIVIKSRYALLDMKCDKFEKQIKKFMRKLIRLVLNEVNKERGSDFQMKDVYFAFDTDNREIMTNSLDNAQQELVDAQKQQVQINTLLGLRDYFDDETILQQICDVLDLEYNDIKDKLPSAEDDDLYTARTALAGAGDINDDGEDGGGGLIA